MKQIHLHGKAFSNDDFKGLVIGGQKNADTLRLVLPRLYANELDFSEDDWIWSITYSNKNDQGDTVLLTKTLSTEGNNIYLDWKPSQTATQVEGKLVCQVTGYKKAADEEITQRFTCVPFTVYVAEWLNPDPITQALPSVIEQALEIMAEYSADVQNAIQAGKDAAISAQNAKASENAAKASEDAAEESETNAKASEDAAKASENAAKESEENADESEANSLASANNAEASAKISERYAKGTEDGQPVSSGEGFQDNSKYYKDLAEDAKTAAQAAQADAEEAKAGAEAAKDQATAIAVGDLTGAISTVTTQNLTPNRVVVSGSSGKVAVSDVTAAELGYISAFVNKFYIDDEGYLNQI